MPTYSYRCQKCDHAFDIQQAFSDDALSVCPECGGSLRKLFSAVGVTFQGSGFYRTDSRAETKKSSETKKSAESKPSDTKPAAKPASTPSTSTT